jgi:hypothetical protein
MTKLRGPMFVPAAIPAVLATSQATRRLPTGDLASVDAPGIVSITPRASDFVEPGSAAHLASSDNG